MQKFAVEFHTLSYILQKANRVLLFAHNRPDSDTTGSVLALKAYLLEIGKRADIACFDPFPEHLKSLSDEHFTHPDQLVVSDYDVIVACDSVERGFQKIVDRFSIQHVIVLIDHHPDIALEADVRIVDATYSSVCEIIYHFFSYAGVRINRKIATFLVLGILGDTGIFQHSNTTAQVMDIASDLIRKGAPVSKIIELAFSNKKISTLHLWGRAIEKAKIDSKSGMIATVVTQKDIEECGASAEDLAQIASILNTVPGTRFSLILSERGDGIIKGSLRSEAYKGVDVSELAHRFGGGGHVLASGFEVKGQIVETAGGWEIR